MATIQYEHSDDFILNYMAYNDEEDLEYAIRFQMIDDTHNVVKVYRMSVPFTVDGIQYHPDSARPHSMRFYNFRAEGENNISHTAYSYSHKCIYCLKDFELNERYWLDAGGIFCTCEINAPSADYLLLNRLLGS